MNNKKDINDYLHLYYGKPCHYMTQEDPGELMEGRIDHYLLGNKFLTWVKPILKKVEDMSLEEWNGIMSEISINVFQACRTYSHNAVLHNRIITNTLSFQDGIILIKYGYDVFNLIDEDLAVNKKTIITNK